MMLLRTTFSRTASLLTNQQSRMLSSQGTIAVEKLRGILEQYRRENYAQELPGRFKKDIVKAATLGHPDHVALEGMQRVLHNIGAAHVMTSSEMALIFEELGDNSGEIPAGRIQKII